MNDSSKTHFHGFSPPPPPQLSIVTATMHELKQSVDNFWKNQWNKRILLKSKYLFEEKSMFSKNEKIEKKIATQKKNHYPILDFF